MTPQDIEKAITDDLRMYNKLPTNLWIYDEVDIYFLALEFLGLTG
jgi:hypothetical protein